MPQIVNEFKKQYPNVKISIAIDNQLKDYIKNGKADVVFDDHATTDNFQHCFYKDEFIAVVPSAVSFKEKSVDIKKLYDYAYISVGDAKTDGYFDKSKFKDVLEFSSVDDQAVLEMIKQGIGVSILPALILIKKFKGVNKLKLTPPIYRNLYFSYKKGKKSYAVTKFIEFLKSYYNV